MAWELHKADLSDAAKAFLSVLGSCGDERKAMREAGASPADVARWAREPEFTENRHKALQYFESWKDWSPTGSVDPSRWPFAGRLDTRPDPYRVARHVGDLFGRRR